MGLTDTELIAKVAKDRDANAFASLYDSCAPMAFSLACQILKNRSEAEDVVQQAFMSLWEHAGQFNSSRARVSTWLHVFVRNRCIDALRRKKGFVFSLDHQNNEDETVSFDVADGMPLPDEELAIQDQKTHVQRALEQLPTEQRSVIEIMYFEGLTQQEISDRLQQPLGTVKTRMRTGLMKLAQLLRNTIEVSR